MSVKIGIGQDSHAFDKSGDKPLMLGGICIPDSPGLQGNSDADVLLHAICNALSGISGEIVLGPISDQMCRHGITDSTAYVKEALKKLPQSYCIVHLSASIECLHPKLLPHIPAMRKRIADIIGFQESDVGITATTGEGLTAFGRGEGIQVFVIATAETKNSIK